LLGQTFTVEIIQHIQQPERPALTRPTRPAYGSTYDHQARPNRATPHYSARDLNSHSAQPLGCIGRHIILPEIKSIKIVMSMLISTIIWFNLYNIDFIVSFGCGTILEKVF
jgi:hypothetical protein